jgi:hypothetical protein
MAIADYFARNAVAAAQAITGLDAERLTEKMRDVRVGIALGQDAEGREGQALTDLLVRLLSRLYPSLTIRGSSKGRLATAARTLAKSINPNIEFGGVPTIELVVGFAPLKKGPVQRIFTGSEGWTGAVSTARPQSCADTSIPFGAGAAACIAAANLFRSVFLTEPQLDGDATFLVPGSESFSGIGKSAPHIRGAFVLAGAGAIGNAAAWSLARTPIRGSVTIVDHERVDLGNLQRYILAERADEHSPKAGLAARYFQGRLTAKPHEMEIARFLESANHDVDLLLLALDSARDRRACQASLPRDVVNAWTQPGDLGVSTHDFLNGACVQCLYLPRGLEQSEDSIIANAFGVPDRLMQIRMLLYRQEGVPRDLLEAIAAARDLPIDRLTPFEGRPVRALYVDGFCAGAVIPLNIVGTPRSDVHVPLAHQSAFAGVLLAALGVQRALSGIRGSHVTQVDVLKPVPREPTRAVAKDQRGICICQDGDYREAYKRKFRSEPQKTVANVPSRLRPAAKRRS